MTATRMLVLGGTGFVGPAVVDEARTRIWAVTVLNRSGRSPRPDVAAVTGERTADGGLDGVAGDRWEVVVDTWARAPSIVRPAARVRAGRAHRYVYVSSRSVYRWPIPAGADESHPTVEADAGDGADVGYARAKAGGEAAAVEAFGDRALLARAGLIWVRGRTSGGCPGGCCASPAAVRCWHRAGPRTGSRPSTPATSRPSCSTPPSAGSADPSIL